MIHSTKKLNYNGSPPSVEKPRRVDESEERILFFTELPEYVVHLISRCAGGFATDRAQQRALFSVSPTVMALSLRHCEGVIGRVDILQPPPSAPRARFEGHNLRKALLDSADLELFTEESVCGQLAWIEQHRPLLKTVLQRWMPAWKVELRSLAGPSWHGLVLQEASGLLNISTLVSKDCTSLHDILGAFPGRSLDRVALTTRASFELEDMGSSDEEDEAGSPPHSPSSTFTNLNDAEAEHTAAAFFTAASSEAESGPLEEGFDFQELDSPPSAAASSSGSSTVFESPESAVQAADECEEEIAKLMQAGVHAPEPAGPWEYESDYGEEEGQTFGSARESFEAEPGPPYFETGSPDLDLEAGEGPSSPLPPAARPRRHHHVKRTASAPAQLLAASGSDVAGPSTPVTPLPVIALGPGLVATPGRASDPTGTSKRALSPIRSRVLGAVSTEFLLTSDKALLTIPLEEMRQLEVRRDLELHLRKPRLLYSAIHRVSLLSSIKELYLVDDSARGGRAFRAPAYPSHEPWLSALSGLSNLTRLALVEFQGTASSDVNLLGLEQLTGLRRLELLDSASPRFKYEGEISQLQKGLSNLEAYAFIGSTWHGEPLLTFPTAITSITELHFCTAFAPLHGDRVQFALSRVIKALPSLPLRRLGLLALPGPLFAPLEAAVPKMKFIEKLQVGLVNLSGETWTAFNVSEWTLKQAPPSLTSLILASVHPRANPLGKLQAASLCELDFRLLGSEEDALPIDLNLSLLSQLTRVTIAHTLPIPFKLHLPSSLETLVLRLHDRSYLTSENLGFLALRSLKSLNLSFSENFLSSSPLAALLDLPPTLTSLSISGPLVPEDLDVFVSIRGLLDRALRQLYLYLTVAEPPQTSPVEAEAANADAETQTEAEAPEPVLLPAEDVVGSILEDLIQGVEEEETQRALADVMDRQWELATDVRALFLHLLNRRNGALVVSMGPPGEE